MNLAPVPEICLDRIESWLPNWNDSLPSTFSEQSDRAVSKIKGVKFQINDLADPAT
jgi:hypothetical protein